MASRISSCVEVKPVVSMMCGRGVLLKRHRWGWMRRREEVRGEEDARRMRDAAGDSIVLRWCSHR